jgi:Uma2 family endonuclease
MTSRHETIFRMNACDTLFVSDSNRYRPGPWTEAEFLALGPTPDRIELIDGSLRVSPAPNSQHQNISSEMSAALHRPAQAADLRCLATINLRLGPRKIVIPDLTVGRIGRLSNVTDASDVLLVSEILSPSNEAYDRVDKLRAYASAGIPWYLLAEPDLTDYRSITLRLYRLDGAAYVEHAVATDGEVLKSDAPFAFAIDTAELLWL